MAPSEVSAVLTAAQHGDEYAKNRLVELMIENRCMARLSKYLYRNRLMEPDDVRGEFWLGVTLALPKAKPTLGDPLQFLTQSGLWRVVSVMRQALNVGIVFACRDCGETGSLSRRVRGFGCSKCASKEIDTHQRLISDEQVTVHVTVRYTNRTWNLELQEFRKMLTPAEARVFDLLAAGYDRWGCDNYLAEIGQVLGVSAVCVAIHLKKIRFKLKMYLQEE